MRVFIVGGTSSLAQALVPVLSQSFEVLTAGRSGCDVKIDLSAPVSDIRLPGDIDVVINTAAHFGGDEFEAMLRCTEVNALGTLKLCHAARLAGANHFINISSIYALLDENSRYFGSYALSKKQADELVLLFCRTFKLPCAILRPSQLYANQDSFRRHQPFLYAAADHAFKGENITIYGRVDAERNYLHAQDFCEIISRVASNRVEGVYSCTHPTDVSLSQVARAAVEAYHSSSEVVFNHDRPDTPDNVFPYSDALYRLIDYYPQISLEDGLKKMAASRQSGS